MVTDARGHEVPTDDDMWGYREDMGLLSDSIADVRAVPNQAAAVTAVADLVAADIDPTGTVWWLANPGTLAVYADDEFQALPFASAIDERFRRLPYSMANGSVTMPATASGGLSNKTVTFPAGQFGGAPSVVTSPVTISVKAISAGPSTVSATSFQIRLANETSQKVTISVLWIASKWSGPAALRSATADEPTDVTVTCPTAGCANAGVAIAIPSTWTDEDGNTQPVDAVECGVCGTDITGTMQPIEGS